MDPSTFSNDHPLTNSADDRLNRAPFAQRIAGVLRGLPKGAGLVIGIHGPWGDGKTTVLNLLRVDLEASADTIPVEFNPWRFTDEASMLAEFFHLLAKTIRAKLTTKSEEIAKWVESVGRYASVIDTRFEKAAQLAEAQAEVGLEDLRRRLSDALREADKRIVILVDDIDRLDKHEIHTLFRLIKACADFPNVCYVLAFDDTMVAQALGERYGGGGESAGRAFLEKVIQVPLKLPVAAKEDLRSLCFEQVNSAIAAAGMELTQDQVREFIFGFDRGVSVRLTTPRAAKRYGNALMFALPMLRGETNPADLLLIEALRAFFPEIYDVIRDHHVHFSGTESERQPPSLELLSPLLESMPKAHVGSAKILLIHLFPRLSAAFGGSAYGGPDWLSRWSRERRISSPNYCSRYFTYAIANNDVSDAVITALIEAAASKEEAVVEESLSTHLVGAKARRVIEKLRAVESSIDSRAAEPLALAFARLAKDLPNPLSFYVHAEPPSQAAILISFLLQRISDRTKRICAAKRVIEAADPLWFAAECLRWLYVTDKPEKQDMNALTKEETAEVRQVFVERIKSHAAEGDPLFDPDIPQQDPILFEWWRAEGRNPVESHLVDVFTKDPKQVPRFLRLWAPGRWQDGDALPRPGPIEATRLTQMKLIIDLDTMAGLVRKHCTGDFENPQWGFDNSIPREQQLAEQFMYIYNDWKKNGDPPAVD